MLDSMTLLTATWECVSQETLVNFFKKAGISSASSVRSQSDDDDPFKLVHAQFKDFQDKCKSVLVDFTVDGYVDTDEDVLTSETHVIKDAEIITRVTQSQYDTLDVIEDKHRDEGEDID